MRQAIHEVVKETKGRGLYDLTLTAVDWSLKQGLSMGLLTVFCRHTSASLLIQENADPSVRADLSRFFETIAPEHPTRYEHNEEGPDDMPAHLRSALTQTQLTIPVAHGRPMLGPWQGIYLFEHRERPHRRTIVLHLIGE